MAGISAPPGLFITATGTEIGKTLVACALAYQLHARGRPVRVLKPVISGFDVADAAASDTGHLLTAAGETITDENIAATSPWRFRAPIAPPMAAARERRVLALDEVIATSREAISGDAFTIIEGVGGVMAPLTEDATVLDWIQGLGVPAVIVTGSYLGALSHTLTAAGALAHGDIPLAGIVISESDTSPVPATEQAACLGSFLGDCRVLILPRLKSGPRMWEAAPDLTALVGD
jgi:dethiobiotin synthetase